MNVRWLLPVLFFASGTSALVFETLWFRQAGLALGNGVWASSLVLSAFMAGLGLGNAIAARWGDRLRRPILVYAALEVAVGAAGSALMVALPAIGPLLAPALRPLLDAPASANAVRLAVAFALLLLPSTAMGASLPLLTRALRAAGAQFGPALGLLYGCNTLGAVAGPLLTEWVLIGTFGVRGSALAAGLMNLAIAGAALALQRRAAPPADRVAPVQPSPVGPRADGAGRWAAAAFGCGFALLALEVLWFRLMLLFVAGDPYAFALMLAVVLAGIGAGGLAASWVLRRDPEAWRSSAALAFLAGAASAGCYAGFALAIAPLGGRPLEGIGELAALAGVLMLPTSLLSGGLFTVLGASLRERVAGDAAAVGLLALANTAGAALGSLVAGFALLPQLGTQRSQLAIALLYGVVGLALLPAAVRRSHALAAALALVACVAPVALVSLQDHYVGIVATRWSRDGASRVVGAREGLTETLLYLENRSAGLPTSYTLVTNSISMSGTHWQARRYMKLFVWLAASVHPKLESALLISYGVGSTARALADWPTLERIAVVDISRDVLETNAWIQPDPGRDPLRDPRVRVHVEDGRHFLQVTDQRFDLITGEPPPPQLAGVVNLYTQEYFALIRERLAQGGIVTYWLPIHSLAPPQGRAVLRAFCNVFEDCSLWSGSGYDLIMLGTRDARGPVSESSFTRLWREPGIADELRALGFERPETLGATFIGDAAYLAEVTKGVAPLVDDHPDRIRRGAPASGRLPGLYKEWMDVAAARERFAGSPLIARLWPPRLREATLEHFARQSDVNRFTYHLGSHSESALEVADRLRRSAPDSAVALWALGSDADVQRAVAGLPGASRVRPEVQLELGIAALLAGRLPEARIAFERACSAPELAGRARLLGAYTACLAGDCEAAAREDAAHAGGREDPASWAWLRRAFALR